MKFSDREADLIRSQLKPPFRITRHWAQLLSDDPDDPLRRQVVPSEEEAIIHPFEVPDPLGEEKNSPVPRLIHRYRDRALIITTGVCALYCRYCFRRRLTGHDYGEIESEEIERIVHWLREHPELKELLLSGGDPLSMSEEKIILLVSKIREVRPNLVMRLATRIPIVDPARVKGRLVKQLAEEAPLWVIIQVNHVRELAPEAVRAIRKFQQCGLPVLSQTVLLKGINDDVECLVNLFQSLVTFGVKPYYLFQGDLAEGTGHFRLPLNDARILVDQLRLRLSGLAMPNFALDLPDGGGKVPLTRDYVLGFSSQGWLLQTPDGQQGYYKDVENATVDAN